MADSDTASGNVVVMDVGVDATLCRFCAVHALAAGVDESIAPAAGVASRYFHESAEKGEGAVAAVASGADVYIVITAVEIDAAASASEAQDAEGLFRWLRRK